MKKIKISAVKVERSMDMFNSFYAGVKYQPNSWAAVLDFRDPRTIPTIEILGRNAGSLLRAVAGHQGSTAAIMNRIK